MTRLGKILALNAINEDFSKPLQSYNEMAAAIAEETGVEIKGRKYSLVILPFNHKHSYRIKMSLSSDGKVNAGKLITIYRIEDKYHVKCADSLKTELSKHTDAVKLATSYYDKNFDDINDYQVDMANGVYTPLQIKIKTFKKVDSNTDKGLEFVVETNSSSMHSVSFDMSTRDKWNIDKLELVTGEYGWGPEILKEPQEKFSYAFTALIEYFNHSKYSDKYGKEFAKGNKMNRSGRYYKSKKVVNNFKRVYDKTIAQIKEVFKKHGITIDDSDTEYYVKFVGLCDTSYGYEDHARKYCADMFDMKDGIDHQSCPMAGYSDSPNEGAWVDKYNRLPELMINDPEGFYNFIMSKDTYVDIDNDNR